MRMDRVTQILRPVVFLAFPVPILAGLGQRFDGTWPGYVAYAAAGIMAAAAVVAGVLAYRDRRR
jgi:hypothetical protein